MNIHENWQKIKGVGELRLVLIYGLMLLTSLGSVGLGYVLALPDNEKQTDVNILVPSGQLLTCPQ